MTSVLEGVLTGMVTALQQIVLSGIDPANVKQRSLPGAGEATGPLPCVCVCPGGNDDFRPAGFENTVFGDYAVEVAILFPSNWDFAGKLPQFTLWREQARKATLGAAAAAPGVWRVDYRSSPIVQRSALSSLYGVVGFVLLVQTVEARS
jgi:hypothetical protein